MTRDDIIRMAREARIQELPKLESEFQKFERFAQLVEAYVRGEVFKPDWDNYRQGVIDGVAAEREECAKVCDELHDPFFDQDNSRECAAAIRARGQQ